MQRNHTVQDEARDQSMKIEEEKKDENQPMIGEGVIDRPEPVNAATTV